MAKLVSILAFLLVILSLLSPFTVSGTNEDFARTVDRKLLGLKQEKLTHFKVYWHDILSGKNPSSVMIKPPVWNSSFFGSINMIDNPLTSKVEMGSKIVGRAQGIYASAAQQSLGFLMVQNFAFTDGKYNGSTIAILGRNAAMTEVREMPVVGGSGLFRFARGYVEARTKWFDAKTGDATVEYNCYVLHY